MSVEHYLMIVRSVTYAQRVQRALSRAGIRCQILRAPRDLSDAGCAYAVRIRNCDLAAALPVLHRERLDPIRIFVSQKGFYQEVAW